MLRQILGYVPSTVIPAVVSFCMVYVYTRMLTPEVYGEFSFVFAGVLLVQNSLFFAVPIATMRFYPEAEASGRGQHFLAQCYTLFYAFCLAVIIGTVVLNLLPVVHQSALLWLALALVIGRSAVGVSQAIRRASGRMWQHNVIECFHALAGFLFGLFLMLAVGRTSEAIVIGLLVAAAVSVIPSMRELLLPFLFRGKLGGSSLVQLIAFTWPLMLLNASVAFQLSDRFLLGSLAGAKALGLYAVAYNLVDRATTLVCTAISTATFPMAVQALQEGREAGIRQAGMNGLALLAVAIPACVGLALTAPHLVAALVGPDFRAGAIALIPLLSVVVLLRNVSTHFIDHAYHLSGRPGEALWVYIPTAIATIALNALLIPQYGAFGAAYAGIICQTGAVMLGWANARRLFPLWLPVGEVIRIFLAVGLMAAWLWFVPFSLSWGGLLQAIASGGCVYVLAALMLNVGGSRDSGLRTAQRMLHRRRQHGNGRTMTKYRVRYKVGDERT